MAWHRAWLILLACAGCTPEAGPAAPDPAEHRAFLPDGACAGCHPAQAAAFAASPMAYSAFSPVVSALDLAVAETAGDPFVVGAPGEADGFCSGCHAPVLARQGIGSDGRAPLRDRLPAADQGGITCDFCHRVTAVDGEANARLDATPGVEKQGPFGAAAANAFHTSARAGHITQAAFCGACHDVRLPRPDVETGADEARLEDLFSEWKASPWADADHPRNPLRGQPGIAGVHDGQEARGEVVTCQDCHMSLYPARGFADFVSLDADFRGVDPASLTRKAHKLYPAGPAARPGDGPRRRLSTHHLAAASRPLLPFPPADWPEALALPPALFGPDEPTDPVLAERRAQAEAATDPAAVDHRAALLRAALTLDLGDTEAVAVPGETLTVDAWVENVGAGHGVPAGFSQEREVWIELVVLDEGRACADDAACADLLEPRRFVDDPVLRCAVHGPEGALDPTLQDDGGTRDRRQRAERSGLCDPDRGRCVVYRSGYLIDQDGDGRVADDDLRHTLVELDPARLAEACVLPGPDADLRPLGVDQGLVIFTNELQRVAVDEAGRPVPDPRAEALLPTATPITPGPADPPVLDQDPRARRSLYATERALHERHRYRTGGAAGLPPPVVHPLEANRFFNGNALRPFEPRLARYRLRLPEGIRGPLRVTARARFRFFPPRLLRALAARRPDLLDEALIDRYLDVVDLAEDAVAVDVLPASP
ncbi:MAG: multiheme c-type cytochrome [bacterium]